jgi:hypothetical protein
MLSEDGHGSVARIAVEDRKLEGVNEVGVALRIITQLAQFAFRHRLSRRRFARSPQPTHLEPWRPATHRSANSYFVVGEAAAAGEAAGFVGAAGTSLPLLVFCNDLVAALAASFAFLLQRATLEVEILRSAAMSLLCLPLLTSFITASQSTLLANAGRAFVANATVVASIAEATTSANFFTNIFSPAQVRVLSNDGQYFKMLASST